LSEIEDKLAETRARTGKEKISDADKLLRGKQWSWTGREDCCCRRCLREAAQTKGDVDVLGNLDYLEVMSHTRALESTEKRAVYRRNDKALEDLGI